MITIKKKYTKQVMKNAIAHHPDAQRDLEEQQPPPEPQTHPSQPTLVLFFDMTPYSMGYHFVQSGSTALALSPHSSLCTSSFLTGRAEQGIEKSSA